MEEKSGEQIKRSRPAKGNKHNRNCAADLWGTYQGEDAFVLGTGTSLAGFDWSSMNDQLAIALNDAVKVEGFFPKFHIFSDVGIWKRYRNMQLHPSTAMLCQKRARDQLLRWEQCSFIDQVFHFNHVAKPDQMTEEDDSLYVARTIATGGITLAWKLGAVRIFLLGIDAFKRSDSYYHDGSCKPKEHRKENGLPDGRITQDRHGWWCDNMKDLRAWFDKKKLYQGPYPNPGIYNLSPLSTIDAWEKVQVEYVLGKDCFK